jgi:hypothetical protein
MNFIRVVRYTFNRAYLHADPLMETDSIVLTGKDAEDYRRHMEMIGVRDWTPVIKPGSIIDSRPFGGRK